jgi:replicative DNA helicase
VLLGGLAGIGKTAFALHAALAAAKAGHPVVYLSVEQGPDELLGRVFCRETGRSIADYWNRDPAYLTAAREVAGRLPLAGLYLYGDPYLATDTEGTVGRLRRWAGQVAAQTGSTPLVVVDYLQRMRPPEADRRLDERRQVSLAGLGLRQLARDLACPVLAISSVNRQSYDKAPSLDAFKGSGDLEYDADACLLLRLAARSDEEAAALAQGSGVVPAELYVVKNRYGALNLDRPVLLDFDRGYGGFRETQPAARSSSNGAGPAFPPFRTP